MTNCKSCEKQTQNNYCNECWMIWINSEEFEKEMFEYLGYLNDDWYKSQIKQNKQKIELFNESTKKLEKELISRIGQENFDKFIQELETTSNEEGDNI